MRILLLSDPNSPHTIKWATALAEMGLDICLFGFNQCSVTDYSIFSNIQVVTLSQTITRKEGSLAKLKYLKALPLLRKTIKSFKPQIVHAHYATSYGLLGALSRFKPFIVSVWGGDVFSFPKKSFLHKIMLKYNLRAADKILSTSNVMAKEANLYTHKGIMVTPFGVDTNKFKPMKLDNTLFAPQDIVIGTIKTLEEKYGVEYLIRAFKLLVDKYTNMPLKLLIVGGGGLEKQLKQLSVELDIQDRCLFTGRVTCKEVPYYQNMLSVSVSVSVSNSESFGVAIVEASACAKAVVVSNVGGLPEVVVDGQTGFVVPPCDSEATAEAIEKLILNSELAKLMGRAGRNRVRLLYDWNNNVELMVSIYEELL